MWWGIWSFGGKVGLSEVTSVLADARLRFLAATIKSGSSLWRLRKSYLEAYVYILYANASSQFYP
jgi:hypothetical protein